MSASVAVEEEKRDDFSIPTKELLAKRFGYICAYPNCKRMTIAVSEDRKSGLTMIGVAAHITAASRKGPRYDDDMSSDERSSEANGIWVCQIHGKFIDDNPSKCSVEELRRWKSQHEQWVFDRVESGSELFDKGIYRIGFENVGIFSGQHVVPFGRHNVLFAGNESGKTTFCQILSAFSGGVHWKIFDNRFDFSNNNDDKTYIEVRRQAELRKISVRLSPQSMYLNPKKINANHRRVQINVNGCPSVDWPRAEFKILYLEDQLLRGNRTDPQDTFIKALRYLAVVLGTSEGLIGTL